MAPTFLLSAADAEQIIDHLVAAIRADWAQACDEAGVTGPERDALWGREFLNPYIFYGRP